MPTIRLPGADRRLLPFTLSGPRPFPEAAPPCTARRAFAAAHVVADPLADADPHTGCVPDWDATIALRRRLWRSGLGVAEATGTARRGAGLDWPTSLELIRRSLDAARDHPGARLFAGCGTEPLQPGGRTTVADVVAAYERQAEAIEGLGGRLILLPSPALAACARSPDHYALVYDRVLAQVREPAIVEWTGEALDPDLAGYWGGETPDDAMQTVLAVVGRNAAKVDGVRVSLLDADREAGLRHRLPPGVRTYTGHETGFPDLIAGDARGGSDAMLGILGAIAPAAAAALGALADGDEARFREILRPTVPLAHRVFAAPASRHRTGLAFLAWLEGRQDAFAMLGGEQSARSLVHLAELFRLADAAGLLPDPDLACARMRALLAVHGLRG